MALPVTLALAVFPSWLLVRYFHDRDLYPEPPRVIWTTFALGALTTIPVLLVVYPAMLVLPRPEGDWLFAIQFAFLYAAVPEEFFKLLVLVGYSLRKRAFDEPMDGLVYGAVAAQGFAALENAMYALASGTAMAIARAFTAVPAHACMGIVMGYYAGRARFEPERRGALILGGYALAVLIHGLYDTPLMVINSIAMKNGGEIPPEYGPLAALCMLMGLGVLAGALLAAVRLWRKARRHQLEHPVPPPLPEAAGMTPHPASVAVPPPVRAKTLAATPPHSTAKDLVLIFVGMVLSIFGGACLFASLHAFFDPDTQRNLYVNLGFAAVFLGYLPLAAGLRMFRAGIRGLNPPSGSTGAASR